MFKTTPQTCATFIILIMWVLKILSAIEGRLKEETIVGRREVGRERERDGDKGPCGERERDFGMVVVGELKRGSDGDGDCDGEDGGGGERKLGDLITETSVGLLFFFFFFNVKKNKKKIKTFFHFFIIIIYLYFKLKLKKNQIKIIYKLLVLDFILRF